MGFTSILLIAINLEKNIFKKIVDIQNNVHYNRITPHEVEEFKFFLVSLCRHSSVGRAADL